MKNLKNGVAVMYRSARELANSTATKIGAGAMVLFAGQSQAVVTLDSTEVLANIGAAAAFIALIGAAVLALHFGAKVWRWAKKAG